MTTSLDLNLISQIFLVSNFLLLCSTFYLPPEIRVMALIDHDSNGIDIDSNRTSIEVISGGSGEEPSSWDCGEEQQSNEHDQQPKESIDCDALIGNLREPSFDITDREFCCVLYSSQSVRSNCCRQLRDLCSNHNDRDCPKPRRRVLPPKIPSPSSPLIIEEDTDIYNGNNSAPKLILTKNVSAEDSRSKSKSKSKSKWNPFDYYKTKKSGNDGRLWR